MDSSSSIPPYQDMMWPTLLALKELGDSASIEELNQRASAIAGFSDTQQSILHLDGPRTEIEYRMAWARTYLKKVGAVDNSGRGVWAITEIGRSLTLSDLKSVPARVRAMRGSRKPKAGTNGFNPDGDAGASQETDDAVEEDWKAQLLNVLQAMAPSSFESFANAFCENLDLLKSKSRVAAVTEALMESECCALPY